MSDDLLDDARVSLLADYDDSLASGTPPPGHPNPELRAELAEVESVRLLLGPLALPGRNPQVLPWNRLGRFEIRRELGRGGCGIVYLAFDPVLGREVALKVPRAEAALTPELRERFHREVRAAAGLDHPHIVPVHEAGEVGPVCFLVSAYCPGPTLAQWLAAQTQPVPFRTAADLIAAIGDAVQHAHDRGVIHRDLKPANILLAGVKDQGCGVSAERPLPASAPSPLIPRITDFGLAKRLGDDSQTRSGALLGTVRYMAPEQAAGKVRDVGPAADVHALGAILYELLTGQPPFKGATDVDTLQQIRTDEPLPPARLRPGLPRDLAVICLRALSKSPARRYPSAGALADDLRRFLNGKPILARPTSAVERVVLWARRRPVLAGVLPVSALTLAALIALAVGSIYHGRFFEAYDRIQAALSSETVARQEADLARAEAENQDRMTKEALDRVRTYDYLNRVLLAHSEWRESRVARAEELLDACPVELRQWEWHYLKRLCTGGRQTLRGHTAKVTSVAYSPDGKWLASGGYEGRVILWDVATARKKLDFPAHKADVTTVAFSPDGRWLATGSNDRTLRVWNVATGQEMMKLGEHLYPITGAAFSPDGVRLVCAYGPTAGHPGEPTIAVWDVAQRAMLLALPTGRYGSRGVAFDPTGTWLANAGWDGTVILWDAVTGAERWTLNGHSKQVSGIAFSPDGSRLASASHDGSVKVWNTRSGKAEFPLHGHDGPVMGVAFSNKGDRLATAGIDQTVRVWDAATGRQLFALRGHTGMVLTVAFGRDGLQLASGGLDKAVNLWEATEGQEARFLMGQAGPVTSATFSPDNGLVASSAYTGEVKVWEAATEKEKRTLTTGLRSYVGSAVSVRTACGWLAPDRAEQRMFGKSNRAAWCEGCPSIPPPVVAVAYLQGGFLATLAQDRTVRLWDVETGTLQRTLTEKADGLNCMAVSPDGHWLAVSGGNVVHLCDLQGNAKTRTLTGPTNSVSALAFSPDSKHLACSGADPRILLWNVTAADPMAVLPGHAMNVGGLSWAPDGQRLASVSSDGTLRLLDVRNGKQTLILDGHTGPVRAVAFSADGHRLVTGGEDGTIRIWDGTP